MYCCVCFLFVVFIYLFICFFSSFVDCLFNWSTEMAVGCADLNGFFYAEQSNDVFSEIQNMLNAPGWSRRDHADLSID